MRTARPREAGAPCILISSFCAGGDFRHLDLHAAGMLVAQHAGAEEDAAAHDDHDQRADQNAEHANAATVAISHVCLLVVGEAKPPGPLLVPGLEPGTARSAGSLCR